MFGVELERDLVRAARPGSVLGRHAGQGSTGSGSGGGALAWPMVVSSTTPCGIFGLGVGWDVRTDGRGASRPAEPLAGPGGGLIARGPARIRFLNSPPTSHYQAIPPLPTRLRQRPSSSSGIAEIRLITYVRKIPSTSPQPRTLSLPDLQANSPRSPPPPTPPLPNALARGVRLARLDLLPQLLEQHVAVQPAPR